MCSNKDTSSERKWLRRDKIVRPPGVEPGTISLKRKVLYPFNYKGEYILALCKHVWTDEELKQKCLTKSTSLPNRCCEEIWNCATNGELD